MDNSGISSRRFSVRSSLYLHHFEVSMEPAGMNGAASALDETSVDWTRLAMVIAMDGSSQLTKVKKSMSRANCSRKEE